MKTLATILLLSVAFGRAQLSESGERVVREQLHSSYTYRFRHSRVTCRMVRDNADEPRQFWRFAASGIGRWGSAFLVPHGDFLAPDEAWLVDTGRGTILGRCRLPYADGDGHLTIDLAEVDGAANWLFVRLRTTRERLPATITSARTGWWHPGMGGMPSRLYIAWPGGVAGAGEQPSWQGRDPQFNGFGFFARGPEADQGSDLMVFAPEDIVDLRLQRFDSVCIPVLTPAKSCRETIFAFGTDPERNAEGLGIPNFLETGRHRVAAIAESIDWEPPPADLGRVRALKTEVAALLARYPQPDLTARFADLQARADDLGPDDLAAANAVTEDLQTLAEDVARHGLDVLLGVE